MTARLFSEVYRLQGILIAGCSLATLGFLGLRIPSDADLFPYVGILLMLSFWSSMADENPILNLVSTLRSFRRTERLGRNLSIGFLVLGFGFVFATGPFVWILLVAAIFVRIVNDHLAAGSAKYYRTPNGFIFLAVVFGFGGSLLCYRALLQIDIVSLGFCIILTLATAPWLHFKGRFFPRGYVFLSYSERRDPRGRAAMGTIKKALQKYGISCFDYTREKLDDSEDRENEIRKLLDLSVGVADYSVEILAHATIKHDYHGIHVNDPAYQRLVEARKDWVQIERGFIRENPKIPTRFFLCTDRMYLDLSAPPNEEKRIQRIDIGESWSDPQSHGNPAEYRVRDGIAFYESYEFKMWADQFARSLKSYPGLSMNSKTHRTIENLKRRAFPYSRKRYEENHIRRSGARHTTLDRNLYHVARMTTEHRFELATRKVELMIKRTHASKPICAVFHGWLYPGETFVVLRLILAMVHLLRLDGEVRKNNPAVPLVNDLITRIEQITHEVPLLSNEPILKSRAQMILSQAMLRIQQPDRARRHLEKAYALAPHEGYLSMARGLGMIS